jgi:hypothetical protein
MPSKSRQVREVPPTAPESTAVERISSSEINKAERATAVVLLAAASKLPEEHFAGSRNSGKFATSIIAKEVSVDSSICLIHSDNEKAGLMQRAESFVISIETSFQIAASFIAKRVVSRKSVMAIVNIAVLIKAIAEKLDRH